MADRFIFARKLVKASQVLCTNETKTILYQNDVKKVWKMKGKAPDWAYWCLLPRPPKGATWYCFQIGLLVCEFFCMLATL